MRLLRDAQCAAKLVRADPVFRVGNTPDRHEPLIEPERRILEDRTYLVGEFLAAITALEPLAVGAFGHPLFAAVWARHLAIGPLELAHQIVADAPVGKIGDGLKERFGEFIGHRLSFARIVELTDSACQVPLIAPTDSASLRIAARIFWSSALVHARCLGVRRSTPPARA